MVYKKFVKKSYKKKVGNGMSTDEKASKALTLATKVSNAVEHKYSNYVFEQAAHWNSSQMSLISDFGHYFNQGIADGQLVGSSVRVRRLIMNMQLEPATSAALAFPVRLLIFRQYDNAGNTAIPPGTLFAGGLGGTKYLPLGVYDPNQTFRYKMLYDKVYQPDANAVEFPQIRVDLDIDATIEMFSTTNSYASRNDIRFVIMSGANIAVTTAHTNVYATVQFQYWDC